MIYKLVCALMRGASSKQAEIVLNAAILRKRELFPDWDVMYLALPKNQPEKRVELLQTMLEAEKESAAKDSCF